MALDILWAADALVCSLNLNCLIRGFNQTSFRGEGQSFPRQAVGDRAQKSFPLTVFGFPIKLVARLGCNSNSEQNSFQATTLSVYGSVMHTVIMSLERDDFQRANKVIEQVIRTSQ